MKLPIFLSLLITLFSCSKSNESNTNNNNNNNNSGSCIGTRSFSVDVIPIIQTVCATSGCHDAGSSNGPGALTTYQQVFNARATIRSAVSSGAMPKNSTLSATQKNAIICWIDAGAANN